MSFGKGSNTTTSTQSPNPQAMAAYNGLLSRAGQVANTPYQAYGGEGVAGINAQQMMGIGNINANAGFAQPYIQQASQYANAAAQPLTAAQIQQYQSPYTQDVINATQNQFNTQNAQQQSQVMGNAAAQGALGGNRAGVAQALTAGQQQQAQAPVIAGLQNQGYQSGLQTALAEQQNMGQAAYSLGNLGVAGQNAALTGANAQIGAGSLQQQTQQALDSYLYGQYQQQQAYPYQQLSWLAGIDTGVGSNMGGTSSTTGPSPNPWNALLGLGAAGLGAAGKYFGSKRGGRIAGFGRHYDGGGGVAGMPWAGAPSWIPAMNITHGSGPPKPPSAPSTPKNPAGDPAALAKGITGLGSMFSKTSAGDSVQDAMDDIADGSFARGGVAGFAEGGAPDYDGLEGGFGPDVGAFSPTPGLDAPVSFMPARRFGTKDDDKPLGPGTYTLGDIGPGTGFDFNPTRTNANTLYDNVADVPLPRERPETAADLPPGVSVPERPVAGLDTGEGPTGGLGIRPGSQGAPDLPPQSKQAGFGGLFHMSDAASNALMAAGLGMMASRSPFLANAIGEGGLAGLSSYSGTKHEEATAEQVAKKLQQHHEETEKKLALESAKEARLAEIAEQGKVPPGYRFKNGNLEFIPGGPHDPAVVTKQEEARAAGKGSASGMSDEAKEIMARQMIAGNYTGYNSLARTAPGMAVRNELNTKAAEIVMRERGLNPAQAAEYLNGQKQEFGAHQIGLNTEARTAGARETNLNLILRATDAAIPAALEANREVQRYAGSIVPLNRIIQHGEIATSDPTLVKFGMANLQLAEHWARAMNPTGVMRESDRDLALKFLDTALSQNAYEQAVMQLQKQITRERDSIRGVAPGTPLNPNAPTPPPGGGTTVPVAPGAAAAPLQPQDKAALDWANANPNDPRAVAIKRKLGVQ